MEYTDLQLKEIERLARGLTPASEISVLLDLKSEDEFLLDIVTRGNPARRAYMRGLATTATQLRAQSLKLADSFAPSAIEQCCTYLKNACNYLE